MLKNIILIFSMGLSFIIAQSPNQIILKNPKANQEINILAVMVEFQKDKFELTYGDGTFGTIYTKDYGTDILDPLPHDSAYFSDHLKFAENYYDEVSKGKVEISYDILPDVITVSKTMRDYSPADNESFKSLGDFSKEVWEAVNSKYSNKDFSKYNLFVIFHAGVGKDISTNEFFGNARDLPSVYLSEKKLQSFYGDSFNGFQLNDGSLVNNTVILPETESREERSLNDLVLLELSINGLIVSSIASHLGLPDLYDSETGKSAIGRFGLMDGQSLFAFRGLFPPEPSAWEKVFLGWEVPKVIDTATQNIEVTVKKAASENNNTIIKIPISASEYYLIENRNRDANKNGAKLTYKVGGQVRVITFEKDLEKFQNAKVDTLKGVLLDIDEFDWAIPGSGILIWHIDEEIINANLANNKINLKGNRGVNLIEADGIQDIGEEFQTIFGDVVIAEGEEKDLWFAKNNSKFYKNVFGPETTPNTNTNSGANSLITISNFSDIANAMSFNLSFGNDNITLTNTYKIANVKSVRTSQLNSLYVLDNAGKLIDVENNAELENFSNVGLVVTNYNNTDFVFGSKDNKLNIFNYSNKIESLQVSLDAKVTAPVVLRKINDSELEIFTGLENGKLNKYSFNQQQKETPNLLSSESIFSSRINQIGYLDNQIFAVSENKFKFVGESEYSLNSNIKQAVLSVDNDNKKQLVLLNENNEIHTFRKETNELKKIYKSDFTVDGISLADLKQDGNNYIVFNSNYEVIAINFEGTVADNFPFKTNEKNIFYGTPISADINSDGFGDVIATKKNGDIFAVSGKDSKVIAGFPISVGGVFSGEQNIIKNGDELILTSASNNEKIFNWNIASTGNVNWESKYRDNFNSSSLNKAKENNAQTEYFPENKTYNWPNPVYGNETFIRTYVSEDSQVEVKIFDLTGALVDEFNFLARGGADSEKAWNVSNIESGAYFAHVKVKSITDKVKNKIIKIAIIK